MKDSATQSFVPVKDIFDGIMIRDDGILCAVVLVSAVNFNLKSDVEREAILHQFRSFLNSLEVDIQILIQSRRLNIKPYLEFLDRLYETQESDLLRLQTREYLSFIKDFTDKNEIMTKQFFIIISYSPVQAGSGMSLFKKNTDAQKRIFEEDKSQLLQRVSFVQNNIRSLGLRAVQLGTEEITELLYRTFNPGDTQSIPLSS